MFRLLRHRLRHNPRVRALWIPAFVIVVASLMLGAILWTLMFRVGSPLEAADRLSARDEHEAAERLYWRAIQIAPLELRPLVAFIDNHASLLEMARLAPFLGDEAPRPLVSEEQIAAIFRRRDLSESVSVLGRYWYEVRLSTHEPDRSAVLQMADADSPVRWANQLLAREALIGEEYTTAAERLEREAIAHPREAAGNLEIALQLWAHEDRWDEVRERLRDPRYQRAAGPSIRLGLALNDRDWPSILLLLWPASFDGVMVWPVLLAVIAGALWFSIAARMGRVGDPVAGRKRLYALAFVLGILSIYPTLVVIAIEETFLGFRQAGVPIADAIYFVFGVGLREEACKILLFLPLLPFLRKRGSRLEALTCGALVGLGFAAEENVSYFHHMSLSVAIVRFLTANFLHMALTGLIAVSLYDGTRAREPLDRFDVVFPLAVLFHGAYDFFLSSFDFGDYSFLSMILFIVLAQRFLRQVTPLVPTTEREDVLRLFVLSLILLSGMSYVYASGWVGPMAALFVVAEGLLGVVIMLFMFVRELS